MWLLFIYFCDIIAPIRLWSFGKQTKIHIGVTCGESYAMQFDLFYSPTYNDDHPLQIHYAWRTEPKSSKTLYTEYDWPENRLYTSEVGHNQ